MKGYFLVLLGTREFSEPQGPLGGGYFFILNTGALFFFWVGTFMGFHSRDEIISIIFPPVGPSAHRYFINHHSLALHKTRIE